MHDVVVIGAGPGGAAAAHYLARRGADVLLVDRAEFPRDKTCGDGLTPRAVAVIADMGLLPAVARRGRRADAYRIVAPAGHRITAAMPSADGAAGYALVVPRVVLDDALRQRAIESGAVWHGGAEVTGVERAGDVTEVSARAAGRPVTFRARMAVIATGASTGLLRRIGVLAAPPRMMIAARAYFEGVGGLADALELRFDGVPLPGYGWVFPLSPTAANIGAGYFGRGRRRITARAAFDAFVDSPTLRRMLAHAERVGPVQGYPLRIDFGRAPTHADGMLMVGEATGLVNPLTGEGIDYALESGRIAAEHLAAMLDRGDCSAAAREGYDRRLREEFQPLFDFCGRVAHWGVRHLPLNLLVRLAGRRADLRALLTAAVLGTRPVNGPVTLGRVLRRVLAR